MTVAAPSRCGLPGFLNADIRELAQACRLSRAGGLVPDSWAVMGMRTRSEPALSLVDRQRERAALDGCRGSAVGARRALMLRGEAGVGKSALLEYVTRAAPDLRVARAVGGIGDGGGVRQLHLLCGPLPGAAQMLSDGEVPVSRRASLNPGPAREVAQAQGHSLHGVPVRRNSKP
jgi:hypothetical protein